MGLRDKLIARLTPAPLDYAAELEGHLSAGDRYLAHTLAVPSAFTRGGGGASSGVEKIFNTAVDSVATAVSSQKHVGGAEGSTASTLTRDADLTVLVLGETTLSWWNFGYNGRTGPAELVQSVPRQHVASITDTGTKAQGGVPVVRFAFADGSFFDYRLMDKPGEEFWGVARGY